MSLPKLSFSFLFFQFSLPCNHFVNYSTDSLLGADGEGSSDVEQVIPLNIEETMAVLTRCSFDEYLRQPIFLLGGIRAIAELIQVSIFRMRIIHKWRHAVWIFFDLLSPGPLRHDLWRHVIHDKSIRPFLTVLSGVKVSALSWTTFFDSIYHHFLKGTMRYHFCCLLFQFLRKSATR